MKLSIILVIQNQDQALYHCMRSLLEQSSKDFEIIAINNGSTDKTQARLNFYSQLHPSLVHVINQTSSCKAFANQIGVNHAKADYILFLEPTQWLTCRTVESFIQEIESSQAELIFLRRNDSRIQLHSRVKKDVLQPRTACKKVLLQEISDRVEGVLIQRNLWLAHCFVEHPYFSSLSCIQLILASHKIVVLPQNGLRSNANFTKQPALVEDGNNSSWLQALRLKVEWIENYDPTLSRLCKVYLCRQRLARFITLLIQQRGHSQDCFSSKQSDLVSCEFQESYSRLSS